MSRRHRQPRRRIKEKTFSELRKIWHSSWYQACVFLLRYPNSMSQLDFARGNNALQCFPAYFFFIFVFSIQLTVSNVEYKSCRWLDSNWCWKWQLYQLSHNHCPRPNTVSTYFVATNTIFVYIYLMAQINLQCYFYKLTKFLFFRFINSKTTE